MRIAARVSCVLLMAFVAWGCGSAGVTDRVLDDPAEDVAAAMGPDVVGVAVERDADTITFRVRFAADPPLGLDQGDGWVDMLLIGIDVPPPGAPPVAPGGEWPGADFALGTHGPSSRGILVRLTAEGAPAMNAEIPIETEGTTLSLRVPRRELGDPARFAVSVAAGREWNEAGDEPPGAQPDVAPDTGTWAVDFGG